MDTKRCISKYHEGERVLPAAEFEFNSKRCHQCVAKTEQAYRKRDKGKVWRKQYTTENKDRLRTQLMERLHSSHRQSQYLYDTAKRRAKKSGIDFSIELSDVVVPQYCPVLGIPLAFSNARTGSTPSLDRIDNSRGYVKGNVAVISWRANFMKRDLSKLEIKQLHDYVFGEK